MLNNNKTNKLSEEEKMKIIARITQDRLRNRSALNENSEKNNEFL